MKVPWVKSSVGPVHPRHIGAHLLLMKDFNDSRQRVNKRKDRTQGQGKTRQRDRRNTEETERSKKTEETQDITQDKDTQLLTLSSQTQFYQTQIKGLQQEINKQKEGPLKKLMRGDFLKGSNLNKNLYDD